MAHVVLEMANLPYPVLYRSQVTENMISVKYASIIAVAAFVAGSFIASPELRAYAANTVLSADIKDGEVKTPDLANNAVTAVKIKDGEVKAADIATDAVGAAELIGVTKFQFGQCTHTENTPQTPGSVVGITCNISGVDVDDSVLATINGNSDIQSGTPCFDIILAEPGTNYVNVWLKNMCDENATIGSAKIGIMVYDK